MYSPVIVDMCASLKTNETFTCRPSEREKRGGGRKKWLRRKQSASRYVADAFSVWSVGRCCRITHCGVVVEAIEHVHVCTLLRWTVLRQNYVQTSEGCK